MFEEDDPDVAVEDEDVELFLDLVLPPSELDFPEEEEEEEEVILLRCSPPVLEDDEFEEGREDLGGFPGDGRTEEGCMCMHVITRIM